MVHHIVLCKLQPGVEDEQVEWIMRQTRIRLLKIGEVRAMGCGKRIELGSEWAFSSRRISSRWRRWRWAMTTRSTRVF